MKFWNKEKPEEAASDTVSEPLVEDDRGSVESSPEVPEDEAMDQQSSEGESAESKGGTSSEDELDTSSGSQVENDSNSGERSSEEDESAALQTDGLAEVNQNIAELRKLFEEQVAHNTNQNKMFDAIHREMKEYKESGLENLHKTVSPSLTLRVETPSKIDVVEATDSSEEDESAALQTDGLAEVNQNIAELRKLFKEQIARNANQNKMFDAIYREMKEYKGNSLVEAFHKPIIQNLIGFYDRFKEIESQLNGILNGMEDIPPDGLVQFQKNLENTCVELEEILYRLEVTPYEQHPDTLDRKLHKTHDTKPTDTPEQDRKVVEVHKIGFYWRDKIFRPEEVTIFRYTPSPTEKGEETDE